MSPWYWVAAQTTEICMAPVAVWPSATNMDSDDLPDARHPHCPLWQHEPSTQIQTVVGPLTQTWSLAVAWIRMSPWPHVVAPTCILMCICTKVFLFIHVLMDHGSPLFVLFDDGNGTQGLMQARDKCSSTELHSCE